jgi:RNA polymerase sigma factor (sigma-70 family)
MLKDAYICTTIQADDKQSKRNHLHQLSSGDQKREALIVQCLSAVQRIAYRQKDRLHHLEMGDLVGEAMLAITEHAGEAPEDNPVGWLVSVGKYRIREYVATQDTLIPHHHRCTHHPMVSLDRLCSTDEDEFPISEALTYHLVLPDQGIAQDHTTQPLYEALNRLSPTRRKLITQRFGLQGNPETPLQEMAPTRRDQQRISKALAGAKRTLASYLRQGKGVVA